MAKPQVITVPITLSLEPSLKFMSDLSDLEEADDYVLDFGKLDETPPFGMLIVGTAIRQFREAVRERQPAATFRAKGLTEHSYASHMGFYQCCGVPFGSPPGSAAGSSRYVPITRLPLADLKTWQKPVAAVIDDMSSDLAEILSQSDSGSLTIVLSYCIRELMRNVAEHSCSDSIWYVAQYWPSRDRVELAIVDEGRGILSSLRDNSTLMVKNEEDAIRQAVQLGVSRVAAMASPLWGHADHCGNSGFGLYVLRELANRAGNLLVLSNSDAVYFNEKGIDVYNTAFRGTAVRLRFAPSKLGHALKEIIDALPGDWTGSKMPPSRWARFE